MNSLSISQLAVNTWTAKAKHHVAFVGPYADAFLKRRSLAIKHPVHDFLFTYYACSPQKLKQWVPAVNEHLTIESDYCVEYPWLNSHWFSILGDDIFLNKDHIPMNTRALAKFIAELCENIMERTPRFGCFGLHEWAMVYKVSPESIRHKGYRLRLPSEELETFVSQQSICCSHYDAYRFFTEEARPLNTLKPSIETRLDMEQGGCLHANMDLYKWAIKLWPWIGSDFIAKAFMLALEGRELDMRASPYDLIDDGYSPICIETESGRRQYVKEQQQLAERSNLLRKELHAFCVNFHRE